MREPIVVVGTGGSGREILALLRDIETANPGTWDFQGFTGLESPSQELLARIDARFLGKPHELLDNIPEASSWRYVLGIGNSQVRARVDTELAASGLRPARLVHPTAVIGPDVEIGVGTTISAQSVLTTNIKIGRGVQVNIGCVIAHDSRLGNFVTLGQSVNLAGNVMIADQAVIHTQAAILPGVNVGDRAVVGAGAVVTRDVDADTVVAGVPARPV